MSCLKFISTDDLRFCLMLFQVFRKRSVHLSRTKCYDIRLNVRTSSCLIKVSWIHRILEGAVDRIEILLDYLTFHYNKESMQIRNKNSTVALILELEEHFEHSIYECQTYPVSRVVGFSVLVTSGGAVVMNTGEQESIPAAVIFVAVNIGKMKLLKSLRIVLSDVLKTRPIISDILIKSHGSHMTFLCDKEIFTLNMSLLFPAFE